MNIIPIKTPKISPKLLTLEQLLDEYVTEFKNKSILAITSKIVSLCEGSILPLDSIDKETLVVQESDQFLPATLSRYGHHFTITNHTLIPMAGVDESNTGQYYALWPRDAQKTCNEVREYLCRRFDIEYAGVIITDSTCHPLRRGTTGICLAHSGFTALNDYVGKEDLFGRQLRVTQSSVSEGLAAAAVVCMGEGAEQTPLAMITDTPFVAFVSTNPTQEELDFLHIPLDEDLFAPFLGSVEWQPGRRGQEK